MQVAQMLVVPQPFPMPFLVSVQSDWREVCATSPAVAGGAPGPGCLHPVTAGLEVTRP